MSHEVIFARIKESLGDRIVDLQEKSERRVCLELRPQDIPDASRLLFRDLGARFQIASGIDNGREIEILYHWAFDAFGFVLTLRTRLDREHPAIDSLAGICKGTEWIEREMRELLGITFRNHPDPRHLLLADDWPEGSYPLRRDYVKDD